MRKYCMYKSGMDTKHYSGVKMTGWSGAKGQSFDNKTLSQQHLIAQLSI